MTRKVQGPKLATQENLKEMVEAALVNREKPSDVIIVRGR